ncbi:hypothetical protein Q5Y75_22055 [Ruegeria sp. 2205SS24-7]|uniref:GFA family protein n=1 Tax=Ruegeria discodermiae TaxID=3064389 RepID=UPI002740FC09|nr:hypothetical protein [Ruegeria sp. 2205SS24-7]MDP5219903.1 hypothetical protein [Ruegeria sp. 2205SS24-7]
MKHVGSCHCGAIRVELETTRIPQDQVLGACQCSFCRKHNARAFSDPSAKLVITASEPDALQMYEFGLRTSKQVICKRCGVYVAMILFDDERVLSVLNIDTLDERALFTQVVEPRVYDTESTTERIARRRQRWTPTTLVGWPA